METIPIDTLSPPCIKMGSDESHFNVLLILRNKVTRQCLQTTNLEEEKGEPKLNRTEGPPVCQPEALPLGQQIYVSYNYFL